MPIHPPQTPVNGVPQLPWADCSIVLLFLEGFLCDLDLNLLCCSLNLLSLWCKNEQLFFLLFENCLVYTYLLFSKLCIPSFNVSNLLCHLSPNPTQFLYICLAYGGQTWTKDICWSLTNAEWYNRLPCLEGNAYVSTAQFFFFATATCYWLM